MYRVEQRIHLGSIFMQLLSFKSLWVYKYLQISVFIFQIDL